MNRAQVFRMVKWLYNNLTHVTVENEHLMPKEGACIITLNHLSRLDFPALIQLERYNDIYCVAADTYRSFPIFGKIISDSDMIWIDRTKADFTAMKRIMTELRNGKIIALAPKGPAPKHRHYSRAKKR